MLWRDSYITCATVAEYKAGKRSSTIIKAVNKNTGKESKSTDFNMMNWGAVTNGYLSSIRKNLNNKKLGRIIDAARGFAKATIRQGESTTVSSGAPDNEQMIERAALADDSEMDSE